MSEPRVYISLACRVDGDWNKFWDIIVRGRGHGETEDYCERDGQDIIRGKIKIDGIEYKCMTNWFASPDQRVFEIKLSPDDFSRMNLSSIEDVHKKAELQLGIDLI